MMWIKLIFFAALLGVVAYSYKWTWDRAQENAVARLNESVVKALKDKQEKDQKRAEAAIKRADSVTKQLNDLKGQHDNETPITTGCLATGDILQRLKTIANSGK